MVLTLRCYSQKSPLSAIKRFFATDTEGNSYAGSQRKDLGRRGWLQNTRLAKDNWRYIPESPAYFSGHGRLYEDIIKLRETWRKHASKPAYWKCKRTTCTDSTEPSTETANKTPFDFWMSLTQYRSIIGENKVSTSVYGKLRDLLKKLSDKHPQFLPEDVLELINSFRRRQSMKKVKVVQSTGPDSWGRTYGLGRRKAATARAWIVKGEGTIMVNGKLLRDVFSKLSDCEEVILPLKVLDQRENFNVWAITNGGGTSGQAQAIKLAIAKALLQLNPTWKQTLRKAGSVTTDSRTVERKKPGQEKARKKYTWVKR